MAKGWKLKFPGFKILDGYITRKFLGTWFLAIILIIVIIVVFDAVEKMESFINNKAPLKAILVDYYLNFVPFFVNQFSGLFSFIAVIFFTSKMAQQTEIIAILSSGVSFGRLMWPYMLSAIVITLFSISLNLWVIPKANVKRLDFENVYYRPGKMAKYDSHIFRQIYPETYAYIRYFNAGNNKASYLAIEKYDGSTIVESLEASDVVFNPETERWSAPKYIIRKFDGVNDIFEQHEKLDTTINLNVLELGKAEEMVKTMPIKELNRFIEQQKAKGSDMISIFEVEKQNRFAYPMASIVLTIIGVAMSSRKSRGGTGLHIGVGIALCFAYIMICRFAEEFAKTSFSPALMIWMPNLIFLGIAMFLYRKAPK